MGGASPSAEDGFFPFVMERRGSFLGCGPGPEEPEDLALQLQQKEKDLLLAAELGKMLLERSEELQRQLEALNAQHTEREEVSRGGGARAPAGSSGKYLSNMSGQLGPGIRTWAGGPSCEPDRLLALSNLFRVDTPTPGHTGAPCLNPNSPKEDQPCPHSGVPAGP